MKKYSLLVLLACLLLAPVQSARAASPFPPAVVPQAELVGKGRLSLMLWDIYDIALYAPQGAYNPAKPYALVYSYLRTIEGKGVADASRDEIKRLGMKDPAKLADWHKQLVAILPDVHKGSVLSAVNIPGKETQFYDSGKKIGVIKDPEFGKYFFNIWLGPQTKEKALRQTLLAGK